MDLTIGSLNLRIGSLGSTHLSDLTKSDLLAGKTTTIAMSESSAVSSSEVNSLVGFATMEKREEKSKNSTNSWETSTWEKQWVTWILTRRTSPPEAAVSPAIYTRYASSSLKQRKKTMTLTT
jgi:hypothetical protein